MVRSILVVLAFPGFLLAQAPAKPAPLLSEEWVEFLSAITTPYELNGKPVTSTFDAKVVLAAARSKDPNLQEAGVRVGLVFTLKSGLNGQKIDPEIVAVIKKQAPARSDAWTTRVKKLPLDEEQRKAVQGGMGSFAQVFAGDRNQQGLEALLADALKQNARLAALTTVAHLEAIELCDLLSHKLPVPAEAAVKLKKPAIEARLVRSRGGLITLQLTNRTGQPLTQVRLDTSGEADQKKVIDTRNRMLGGGLLFLQGSNRETIEAAKQAANAESAKNSLGTTTFTYISEWPAGGIVRTDFADAATFGLLQSAKANVSANELPRTTVDLTLRAGLDAKPLEFNKNSATVTEPFTKQDVVDMDEHPFRNRHYCHVYSLQAAANATVVIRADAKADRNGSVNTPCLRVQSPDGTILADERLGRDPMLGNALTFRAKAAGEYHIVVTNATTALCEYQLTVTRK